MSVWRMVLSKTCVRHIFRTIAYLIVYLALLTTALNILVTCWDLNIRPLLSKESQSCETMIHTESLLNQVLMVPSILPLGETCPPRHHRMVRLELDNISTITHHWLYFFSCIYLDPLFFMHHTQIDRLWWLWQQEMPSNRTYDFSGIRTQDNSDGKTPPAATLNDLLPMLGMAKDLPVKQLMKTQTSLLCYRYWK